MKKNNLKILLYHGVTDHKNRGVQNYSGKHVHVNEFYKQMNFIKKNCNVLSIDQVPSIIKKKNFLKNSVVVSFDDGFENNYKIAVPILKKFSIPAVFYITAGMIGKKKMFWVDQIEDLINLTKKKEFFLKLSRKLNFSIKNKKEKIIAINKIKKFCKKNSKLNKEKILKNLKKILNDVQPNINHSKNYKSMSWNQLKKISKNSLFTIGGHSYNHNIFSKMTNKDMKKEITKSINLLSKKLNLNIKHYAYPEGQKGDFNIATIKFLKSKKIICCPTAIHGDNPVNTNLFYLKRIMVGFEKNKFPFNGYLT